MSRRLLFLHPAKSFHSRPEAVDACAPQEVHTHINRCNFRECSRRYTVTFQPQLESFVAKPFMRRTAQLLRSLLSILLITVGEGIQFLWLAVSSRAELSAEVLFLRKQLAFYREHQVPPRRLTDAARFSLVLGSQLESGTDDC